MVVFNITGHKNILGTHKNTIEFTKDSDLSLKGDCIIGVRADYDLDSLKTLVKNNSELKIIIKVDNLIEEIKAVSNPNFNDEHEIVIRKTDFVSGRTLAVKADKAVIDLDRSLLKKLKNPDAIGKVEITEI